MISTNELKRDNKVFSFFNIVTIIEVYETKALVELPGGKRDVYADKEMEPIPLTP